MSIAAENKAKLIFLDPSGKVTGDSIDVQFNPSEYSTSWAQQWNEVGQKLQWQKTTPAPFTLKLMFDTYETRKAVTDRTNIIKELLMSPKDTQARGCLFQWGKSVYRGVVENLQEDFTMFLEDGTPVRSLITLTIKPWPLGGLQDPGGGGRS